MSTYIQISRVVNSNTKHYNRKIINFTLTCEFQNKSVLFCTNNRLDFNLTERVILELGSGYAINRRQDEQFREWFVKWHYRWFACLNFNLFTIFKCNTMKTNAEVLVTCQFQWKLYLFWTVQLICLCSMSTLLQITIH